VMSNSNTNNFLEDDLDIPAFLRRKEKTA